MTIIKTDRLILRPWEERDLGVMEYFPSVLSKTESDQL
jgi:hypothetical protein